MIVDESKRRRRTPRDPDAPKKPRKAKPPAEHLADVPAPHRLIAIDPGLADTGWCVFDSPHGRRLEGYAGDGSDVQRLSSLVRLAGHIATSASDSLTDRLRRIVKQLDLVLVEWDGHTHGFTKDTREDVLVLVEYPALAGFYKRNESDEDPSSRRGMIGKFDKLHDCTGAIMGMLLSHNFHVKLVRPAGTRKAHKHVVAHSLLTFARRRDDSVVSVRDLSGNVLDAAFLGLHAICTEVWRKPTL